MGNIISDLAFSSSSVLKNAAFTQQPVFMQILVPAGSKGAYINTVSRFKDIEYEMLFQRGSQFMILDAVEHNGKIFIRVLYKGVI